jgi:hypothetical protein
MSSREQARKLDAGEDMNGLPAVVSTVILAGHDFHVNESTLSHVRNMSFSPVTDREAFLMYSLPMHRARSTLEIPPAYTSYREDGKPLKSNLQTARILPTAVKCQQRNKNRARPTALYPPVITPKSYHW